MDALILPKITDLMPSTQLDLSQVNIPENLVLADPHFYKPAKVDILIGAELFFDILKNNTVHINNSLIMKETVFGYVVCGTMSGAQETKHCGFISQFEELEENVKQFWSLENIEDSPSLKDEEIECEKLFCETTRRDSVTGKYTVNLPTKDNMNLGESKHLAKTRLDNLWKKLNNAIEMKTLYTDFMEEYKTLGHMQEIEFSDNTNYYIMPHHGVFRADSSTTKLRVVFDASAPSSNGISLNNCLLKGGVVQDDLFSILLRFRKHKIAFVADIQKMYRQIWVNPEQRNLQCILWKSDFKEDTKLFQLNTVTYGTACAPFLATRVLKQLALDEKEHYPLASASALSDFYVDDILTGAADITTALKLQQQLIEMLNSGGMTLHKWSSNKKQLLDRVSDDCKEYDFLNTNNNTVKTLGLRWEPREDTFCFKVSSGVETPTKRSVLSEIARLFDPLGLLGPVVTQAKKFMQALWQLKIDWNDELPYKEKEKWELFRRNLLELRTIRIPRYVLVDFVNLIELHGFSDASKEAFGAAVYLRCLNNKGEIKVSLLCSKSRISPLKEVTIPRLELCGAVLLARLVKKVRDALKINLDKVFLYTDSKIVLAWIAKPLAQLKLFVKNRVSVIQDLTELNCWRHISSKDNPADVLSRGLDAHKIENCKLWWVGPTFLHEKEEEFKDCDITSVENTELYLREIKSAVDEHSKNTSLLICESPAFIDELLNLSNNYDKVLRIFSFILRFAYNCRNKKRITGSLTLKEIATAENLIIKAAQLPLYSSNKKIISGNVCNLNPFVDEVGILRIGGRLEKASVPYEQKHPAVLPKNCKLSKLIFYTYHLKLLHVGPQALLNAVRLKFWPLGGRNLARNTVHSCVTCFKCKPILASQIMGNLPSERLNVTYPFNYVGLDLCGPFFVSYKHQRKKFA